MDYTPYYETMRRTSLLRGMTDAELDTLMACFAPRVRRYAKGELLLMAGYETHEVGLVLEGAITASKPLADGSTVVMARMGPGGVFADVLAGGRSRSPVNVSAAEACLALYLPCEALLRPPATTSANTPPGPMWEITTVLPSASGLLAVMEPSSTRPTSRVSYPAISSSSPLA